MSTVWPGASWLPEAEGFELDELSVGDGVALSIGDVVALSVGDEMVDEPADLLLALA